MPRSSRRCCCCCCSLDKYLHVPLTRASLCQSFHLLCLSSSSFCFFFPTSDATERTRRLGRLSGGKTALSSVMRARGNFMKFTAGLVRRAAELLYTRMGEPSAHSDECIILEIKGFSPLEREREREL